MSSVIINCFPSIGLHWRTPLSPSVPLAAGAGSSGRGEQDEVLWIVCQHGHGLNILAHQHQSHYQPGCGRPVALSAQRQLGGREVAAPECGGDRPAVQPGVAIRA